MHLELRTTRALCNKACIIGCNGTIYMARFMYLFVPYARPLMDVVVVAVDATMA